jgi:hypothetical protein
MSLGSGGPSSTLASGPISSVGFSTMQPATSLGGMKL